MELVRTPGKFEVGSKSSAPGVLSTLLGRYGQVPQPQD